MNDATTKARHFLTEETAFRLGILPTEASHPETASLSTTIARSTRDGVRMLMQVDHDIPPVVTHVVATEAYARLVESLIEAVSSGKRVFFTGCGATGRLAILLEAAWRAFWQELFVQSPQLRAGLPNLEDCVVSVMAGGDYALIRSVEGFEDSTDLGRYPPYDERWPPEKKPADRLTLLDRRFSAQFCLTQAKAFVWGMQPTIPNFKAELLSERPEEIDYLKRLVHTRMLALKFLLHGTWLRPPVLDVPDREIDIAILGPYDTKLTPQKRRCPVAIAGAWRAPDGNVAVALASIHEETLSLQLPIDLQAYGLGQRCSVDYIDSSGRRRLGTIEQADPRLPIKLRPQAICVLEFARTE